MLLEWGLKNVKKLSKKMKQSILYISMYVIVMV